MAHRRCARLFGSIPTTHPLRTTPTGNRFGSLWGTVTSTPTPDQQLASAEQNESAVESELGVASVNTSASRIASRSKAMISASPGSSRLARAASEYPFSGVDDVVSGFADFAGVERAGM